MNANSSRCNKAVTVLRYDIDANLYFFEERRLFLLNDSEVPYKTLRNQVKTASTGREGAINPMRDRRYQMDFRVTSPSRTLF